MTVRLGYVQKDVLRWLHGARGEAWLGGTTTGCEINGYMLHEVWRATDALIKRGLVSGREIRRNAMRGFVSLTPEGKQMAAEVVAEFVQRQRARDAQIEPISDYDFGAQ